MAAMVGVMVPTFNPSIWESGVGRSATKAWATFDPTFKNKAARWSGPCF